MYTPGLGDDSPFVTTFPNIGDSILVQHPIPTILGLILGIGFMKMLGKKKGG